MSETSKSYPALFLGRRFISGLVSEEKLKQLASDIISEYSKSSSRGHTELVSRSGIQTKQTQEESRCNLEVADKHLHVTYIRKDEGFESDGESTKSSSNSIENNVEKSQIHSGNGNVCVDNFSNPQVSTNSAGFEEQIVNDHVFIHPSDNKRSLHNNSKSQASPSTSLELETSSAASSGSDYDENVAFKSSGPQSIMTKENAKTLTSIIDEQNCGKEGLPIDPNLSSEATSSSTTSKSNSPTADLQRIQVRP